MLLAESDGPRDDEGFLRLDVGINAKVILDLIINSTSDSPFDRELTAQELGQIYQTCRPQLSEFGIVVESQFVERYRTTMIIVQARRAAGGNEERRQPSCIVRVVCYLILTVLTVLFSFFIFRAYR